MIGSGGIVYLVGAGPGDAGLITVRGAECLAGADVVVYDHLANEALLAHAPAGAECVFAGKMPGHQELTQEETNELLVDRAREGKVVVRPKGGDPFVFGRGGEEAIFLAEHGIEFEVVPGVTSAIAVPAYAGIPVTHRDINLSLHIIAGHDRKTEGAPEVDWATVAKLDGTLVFLMGVRNLPGIVRQLLDNGKSPDTPVALVRWGTLPEQETLVSTLDKVVADAARVNFLPPVVTVVGAVVALRTVVKWAERRPLFGVRAAVTRPVGEGRVLMQALGRAGADVWLLPTIAVQPRKLTAQLRRELKGIGSHQWAVFTSAAAVRVFFEMLADTGRDARALAGVRVAAMGDHTASALKACGIVADAVPPEFVQESLAAAVPVEPGDKVLIPRAADARRALEQDLVARGAEVHVLPVYDTTGDANGIARLRHELTQGAMNLVTFTSASTFERFADSVKQEDLPKLFADVTIASIGPETSRVIKDARLEVAIEATRHTSEGLAEEILSHYRRHHSVKDADTSTKG